MSPHRVLKELANGKAPGADIISIQLFKVAGEEAIKRFTATCTLTWSKIVWPKRWKQSVYIRLSKKRDARECSGNQTIAFDFTFQQDITKDHSTQNKTSFGDKCPLSKQVSEEEEV